MNLKSSDIESLELNTNDDIVYRTVLVSERLPEDPGYYFCFTAGEERIVLNRGFIIENSKFIKYWLEPVPRVLL